MELFRLHAYAVSPHRTGGPVVSPVGGAVKISAQLRRVVEENTSAARFDVRTEVVFQVDTQTRTNETRDLIVAYAFDAAPTAKSAAVGLALRLSEAMDMRSSSCLLVLAAMRQSDRRSVTIWTFPRDQAIQFRSGQAGPSIRVLTDVFSQSSSLRKAALFEGRKLRNQFLTGRVLDFQAAQIAQSVANFWISSFLQCALSIGGDAGTRLLAKVIRKTFDACTEIETQEQMLAAVMAVRRSPRSRWSLEDFANHFLNGVARDTFLRAVPNDQSRISSFDFQRDTFDKALKFGVFALDTGVWVSSPLTELGRSVNITGDVEKKLTCEGTVVGEKVRARHA